MPHIQIPHFRRHWAALVFVLLGLSPAAAVAQQNQANPYYEFLQARRLEGEGNNEGALAALQRAAKADPNSAEIKAEIAALHMRRVQIVKTQAEAEQVRAEADKAAKEALAIDSKNVEANRTLGYLYAQAVESARTPSLRTEQDVTNAIQHLERTAAGTIGTDQQLQYTLGRMYLRNNEAEKAVQAVSRVVSQNPGSAQARQLLASAYVAAGNVKGAIATLSEVVEFLPALAVDLGGTSSRMDSCARLLPPTPLR